MKNWIKPASLLVFPLFFLLSSPIFGQQSTQLKTDNFWQRVSLGGYLGFQVGNATGIVISPEAQVRVVNQLYMGLGLSYQYYWYKNYYYNRTEKSYTSYSYSVYGGRIFSRYYLRGLIDNALGNIFGHLEYEYLYYVDPYKYDPKGQLVSPSGATYSRGNTPVEINSLFIGGGYSQPVAGRAFIDILILYNLNDTPQSPYSNPVFRIGFGVGL
jgi:hypothetical protein